MANVTYIVKKGDTLWALAKTYNTTVDALVKLNDISNPDYIVVGQKLIISGTAAPATTNYSYSPTIKVFGLQSNTNSTLYATWTWSKSNTDCYRVLWEYWTGNKVWFVGTDSTVTVKQSVYNAPTNATKVRFRVMPIAKKHKVNNREVAYWTGEWSTVRSYDFSTSPPSVPPVPTVTVENYNLTAKVENLDVGNASSIQFQVYKDDKTLYKTGYGQIYTRAASYTCTIEDGHDYKVRARSYKDTGADKNGVRTALVSAWSDYSANVNTKPASPKKLTICRANSETSVYLEWPKIDSAKTYEIEYANKKTYFDGSDATTTVSGIETTHYEKTGLTAGEEYFFRVRAVNDKGASAWSAISSTVIGVDPSAPTTWSSTTTAVSGESITLHWVHNSEDGSSQTYAELELTIGGVTEVETIKNSTNEDEKDKTSTYIIDTTSYTEGSKIQWRVRTAGITKAYGDWSILRTIDIYAPATLGFSVTDTAGNPIDTLTTYPFYVSGTPGPNTQSPISYHLSITANGSYDTLDNAGNPKTVREGDEVYSKHFDISEPLLVEISANNVNLENNISYTVTCLVTMDSGLMATSSSDFVVGWTDIMYAPNAEIYVDRETLSASIRPHCVDDDGNPIEGVTLSVYRREYDGSFTEIATGVDNTTYTYVSDPHPALDYARYRIIATTVATGAVSYCDVPGYPVGEAAVIIQWDETWSSFDTTMEDAISDPSWSGSMLKLPYNIDISDSTKIDVAHVEYIGRKHPVSYYGTQLGVSSTWNVVIEKDDVETLYGLRRLATWTGDVYVREPSGSGYWATVSVSFSQKHKDLTIPVTIEVTRVEGGV